MIVYKAQNIVSGKVYIGQTRYSLENRIERHLRAVACGSNTKFHQAIRKYGPKSFEWTIICRAYSKEELNRLETFYIQQYNSIKKGYNMVDGGDNNIMDIPEVKAKHKDRMRSIDTRNKISATIKKRIKDGTFFTDEHRKRLSEAAKGNHNFGSGDTRSIGCYCIDVDGNEHHFHSYRDAWKWWSSVDNVFDTKAECTYQRAIKKSICTGMYTYKGNKYSSPRWYKEVMSNEVTDKI